MEEVLSAQIELINTGSELLFGRVLNAHSQWIGRRLADCGYELSRQSAVPDAKSAIQQAVGEALSRSDVIITTGGLVATSVDRTKEWIAELLNRPLAEDRETLRRIECFFQQRNRSMPTEAKAQALIPQGAKVLPNPLGTDPGLALMISTSGKKRFLLMLPGTPEELRLIFARQGLPWLQAEALPGAGFACRILRCVGIEELQVEEQSRKRLGRLIRRGLEIGYCSQPGEVELRFTARGKDAAKLTSQAAAEARKALGEFIYGEGDDRLEDAVVRLLSAAGKTLTVAESCTGGYLAHRLTNVPGASQVFDSGLIVYSNESKMRLLGVSPAVLQEHGAVSENTAQEMADGARRIAKTDYAISVTGIAGPTGGTSEKPVGTAFIGLADAQSTTTRQCHYPGEREAFKRRISQQALDLLRRRLLRTVPPLDG